MNKGELKMSTETNNETFNIEARIKNGDIVLEDMSRSLAKSGEYMSELYERYNPKVVAPERRFKYFTNHVFDENKSVKWNREEVVRQNKIIENSIKKYHKDLNSGYANLISDIKIAIESYFGDDTLNDAQIDYVINYAKDVSDSKYELVEKIISMVDFIYDLNNLAK